MQLTSSNPAKFGLLAFEYCKKKLPLQVLKSGAGYYIGTSDEEGPCSRESAEYFRNSTSAEMALSDNSWTQRDEP